MKRVYRTILFLFLFFALSLVCAGCAGEKFTARYLAGEGGKIEGMAEQILEAGADASPVTAQADEGYTFVKWSDGITTPTRTDKNLSYNLTATARFEKKRYVLRYETDGNGTIRGEAEQTVEHGENAASVTAVPNVGYKFVKWSDGVKTATRTDKNVAQDLTVTAEFEKKTYYTVRYETDGNGTVEGKAEQSVEHGKNASPVTAIPNEGYEFVKWSDGTETPTRTDKNVTEDLTVKAEFEKLSFTVRYLAGENGTVEGETEQTLLYGENASSVTAIPNEGYKFSRWSDGEKNATRRDMNVTHSLTVTAEFTKIQYREVTYRRNGGGTIVDLNTGEEVFRYSVPYEDDAPPVKAVPYENRTFLYWSDGSTDPVRQDTNIRLPITVTAYFGDYIDYKVHDGVGGTIAGKAHQEALTYEEFESVTAVPDKGYLFMGWSDGVMSAERRDNSKRAREAYYAYFEPIEKTFRYDYGIASGTPTATEITIDRYQIQNTKFVVPQVAGYTFCGWYADKEYRIRFTNEAGRYLYGYAAFSVKSDTLYAKWQAKDEKTDNHKVLLIFVDEVQTELYSSILEQTVQIHSKMSALDYEMSKWIAETIYTLLNEWFEGEVKFEVDSYYTTSVLEDGFSGGLISSGNVTYYLFADDVSELTDLPHEYHNTIVMAGLDDYDGNFFLDTGNARVKDGFVKREDCWDREIINGESLLKQLEELKAATDLNNTVIAAYLHEFAHTVELYSPNDLHNLHTAESELRKQGVGNLEIIKRYLRNEWESDGVKYGIPMEYWKHRIELYVQYGCQPINQRQAGKIVLLNEAEDPDREPWENFIGKYVAYGSEMSVEAIPYAGYRFVRWSDGVTTAARHDKNIIAYFSVDAIFEKLT